MREYEIVYIFRSNFTPEEIEAKLERYHALLTDGDAGEITAVEQWGKRPLAYPIDKQTSGYYVVAQFTTDPAAIAAFERLLKLDEDLLRYLIVLSEGELPIPGSMQAEMDERVKITPGKSSDDDDDDDDDDEGDEDDAGDEDDDEGDEAGDEDDDEGDDDEGDDEGDEDDASDEDDAGDEDDDEGDEAGDEEDAEKED